MYLFFFKLVGLFGAVLNNDNSFVNRVYTTSLFVIVIWKNKIRLKINGVCNDSTLTNSFYRINW